MTDSRAFADRQLELTAEFGKFVFDHPEVDAVLPNGAYVYFEVAGETEFNQHSRDLAEQKRREGMPVILVRIQGLAPPQGSRLIDPLIESMPIAS
jgi:hypothetical protein